MDEDYYNWIHFSDKEENVMIVSGDKAKLIRGPLRNREVTLLHKGVGFWACSLVFDGVETEFHVNESDLEALDNG